ncbi:hypothetical protein V6N13_082053 [Hibiscus sabdariffa]
MKKKERRKPPFLCKSDPDGSTESEPDPAWLVLDPVVDQASFKGPFWRHGTASARCQGSQLEPDPFAAGSSKGKERAGPHVFQPRSGPLAGDPK